MYSVSNISGLWATLCIISTSLDAPVWATCCAHPLFSELPFRDCKGFSPAVCNQPYYHIRYGARLSSLCPLTVYAEAFNATLLELLFEELWCLLAAWFLVCFLSWPSHSLPKLYRCFDCWPSSLARGLIPYLGSGKCTACEVSLGKTV